MLHDYGGPNRCPDLNLVIDLRSLRAVKLGATRDWRLGVSPDLYRYEAVIGKIAELHSSCNIIDIPAGSGRPKPAPCAAAQVYLASP